MFVSVLAIRLIPRDNVTLVRELGEGAFGRVHLGVCTALVLPDDVNMVAVKTLKVCVYQICSKLLISLNIVGHMLNMTNT